MSFLLLKALHLIAVVAWFAGLFYLPRLFVYHAMSNDAISDERFKIMERKLYRGIMTPAAILAIVLGITMVMHNPDYLHARWMQLKLAVVFMLIIYHVMCGQMIKLFAENRNKLSHVFYRWFNEVPVVFLVIIIILAIVKPF